MKLSTTTTIVPDKGEAWLRTDQKVVSSNARHTRTLLERFSSNNILSIPYHYPKDVQTDSEWREPRSLPQRETSGSFRVKSREENPS